MHYILLKRAQRSYFAWWFDAQCASASYSEQSSEPNSKKKTTQAEESFYLLQILLFFCVHSLLQNSFGCSTLNNAINSALTATTFASFVIITIMTINGSGASMRGCWLWTCYTVNVVYHSTFPQGYRTEHNTKKMNKCRSTYWVQLATSIDNINLGDSTTKFDLVRETNYIMHSH